MGLSPGREDQRMECGRKDNSGGRRVEDGAEAPVGASISKSLSGFYPDSDSDLDETQPDFEW